MLAKAVKQHIPSQNPKGASSQQPKVASNALQPSPSAVLNTSRPSWPSTKNPLKRTSSQAMGGYISRNAAIVPGSESSTSRHTSMPSTGSKTQPNQPSASGGRVDKLHDSVFFDENDFEDDANIDLDSDAPSSTTLLDFTAISYPTLRSHAISTTPSQGQSSAPIPWSSSPPHHKSRPHQASALPAVVEAAESHGHAPKNAKRRTLPWSREVDDEEAYHQTSSSNPHGQQIFDRGGKRKAVADGEGFNTSTESFATLPKHRPDSQYPWNKTSSAVKKGQKALREGHKKLLKGGIKRTEGEQPGKITSTKAKTIPRVFLSDEQKKVLDLVADARKSVFFTGSAGTGKSVLLREIIKVLREKQQREPDRVAVTASTGLAACNVSGVTLHSFAGIGLGKEPVPELVRKIKRNSKAKLRWMRTKILIIDEISMVDGDLFDKLEGIARIIRNNGRPFGGIQLVITGDFFQLPPVPDFGRISKFAFDAATWNTSIEHTIGLTQVFRQKDPAFADMLNEMRVGRLSNKSINTFRTLSRPLNFQDDFQATELFPTRNEVEAANNGRMANLGGLSMEYVAEDGGSILDKTQRDKLLANCMAPQSITLKKGAQVMLIKNFDDTLVNGSIGKVIAFMDEKMYDYYHEEEDLFQAVEKLEDDERLSDSRKKLKAMMNKNAAGNTSRKWPLVRFQISDGSCRDLLCERESWKIELPSGEVQASRSQVPLILAWALSIHKAQGQTLERVKVDLGKIFEKGQAYVALSRATCQEGLQIMRFDPKKVMAHEKVRTFYDSLYSVEEAPKAKGQAGDTKLKASAKDHEANYVKADYHSEEEDNDALQEMYA